MEVKIFVYGLCLAAIVAAVSFWQYTMSIDEAQHEVLMARDQQNSTEDGLKRAKEWLVARKEAAALIKASSVIEADNTAILEEIKKAQNERTEIAKNFMSTIERVRSSLNGALFPTVTLTTGATLTNAKVQSLDQETTVFQHSGGVSKVPTTTLPSDFQDKLRYGFNPGGLGQVIPISKGSTGSFTSVSDKIARTGMTSEGTKAEKDLSKREASPPQPAAKTPAGTRQSLGRTYVPGKGWINN